MSTSICITATCYTKQGQIISKKSNSYVKTHPLQKQIAIKVGHPKKEYLHAEIAAIIAAKHHKIHKIKIERYNKDGKEMLAKPCPICQWAIKSYKISIIEYTQ